MIVCVLAIIILIVTLQYFGFFRSQEMYSVDLARKINPGFGTQLNKYQLYPLEIHDDKWFNRMTKTQGEFGKYISYLQERPQQSARWALTDPM